MGIITVRGYTAEDIAAMTAIWNSVVAAGDAFPQETGLASDAAKFFASQTHCGVALDGAEGNGSAGNDNAAGQVVGLYILHPNNTGRCAHIANASYAVSEACRGRHIGEALVRDCMEAARRAGFRILQFNAVVATNTHARHLYERLGFQQLGTIKGGFRMTGAASNGADNKENAVYVDICPYYISLV